eukprot:TRINITY_DN12295_c0_g2_i1.p1 TRINITY_DN12295_c0_g2~~TRINITY_DN12295_c0_g2_i1.p1  ORF type:complete len:405 (-),score=60.84 TRINITY_DN12295_c0_g2_i1:4-1218(-)
MWTIWDWALRDQIGISQVAREQLSVVLVAPSTTDSRELKEMVTLILRGLGFKSIIVHQEAACATFGNGILSACVVSVGAHVTSVTCVEDGAVIPTSRVVLPFGGEDVSFGLEWVEQQRGQWPDLADPEKPKGLGSEGEEENVRHLALLDSIKQHHCCFATGTQTAEVAIPVRTADKRTTEFVGAVLVSGLNVAPMGLFFPLLLAPMLNAPTPHPRYRVDHEDTLEDYVAMEYGRRPEGLDGQPDMGPFSSLGMTPGFNGAPFGRANGGVPRGKQQSMGVHHAVIQSIDSLGREEMQSKLFTSIQLIGGGTQTKGFVDFLEERLLETLPSTASVESVEVLLSRHPASIASWKGGALIGVLDFTRELWVQREDWLEGGVRLNLGRKYRESLAIQTQLLWYCSTILE